GAERDQLPGAGGARVAAGELRRREVFDREPERLEERQLVIRGSPGVRTDQHLPHLRFDVVGPGDRALAKREQVVAGLVDGRLAAVDEERGGGERAAVRLPGRRD